jgi:hypothetical protein
MAALEAERWLAHGGMSHDMGEVHHHEVGARE